MIFKKIVSGLIMVYVLFFIVVNTFQIASISAMDVLKTTGAEMPRQSSTSSVGDAQVAVVAQQVLPQGVPAVYGPELNVSFSDPVPSFQILDSYDRGALTINLEGDDLARYINIAMQAACEYCCGAKTLVFSDGKAACGCAHSAAMRGVAKYLIQKHGSEYTDEQILAEVNKWKATAFPRQTVERALGNSQAGSATSTLPSQVGGC